MRGHTYKRKMDAMDQLERIVRYIAEQFHLDMTRDEAKSNLDARFTIFRLQNRFLVECGLLPVTNEEVCVAVKKEKFDSGVSCEAGH